MRSVANAIIVLWGWRRLLVAFVAGAASALAFAPFYVFPILWLTLPVFVWLIDGATPPDGVGLIRRVIPAALVGWAFGFGYFLAGLWWLGAAFLVDADQFAWAMPLGVVGLPAGLALFWAFGSVLARLAWSDGWPRLLAFAVAMSAAEWLRGHLFTGFPWNAVGYALTPAPLMMQSAALVGLWGLTLAAFLIFAAPALLTDGARSGRRGRGLVLAFAALLLLAHVGYGALRLHSATNAVVADVRLRIVQPAIDQSEKFQIGNTDAIFKRYLELSDTATSPNRSGVGSATLLIWPESAFPFLLTERPDALAAIAELLPAGTTLVTGAVRAEPASGDAARRVFNSVYVIADDGEILSAYDKVNLVPFGEFLPFQNFLEALGIRQLTELPGGFSAGSRRRTLALSHAPPVGPLICYEAIFPGAAVEPGNRPGWLLNVTNDTWFGDTPGPRQHFLQARVRAVEEGLPLVRAANSGISAIVDAFGRVLKSLDVGQSGVVDGDLPETLPATLYARFGDAIFWAMLAATVVISGLGRLTLQAKRN
jgi:apolipoprotein N-acyltransferase